jgi:hypothetical protein
MLRGKKKKNCSSVNNNNVDVQKGKFLHADRKNKLYIRVWQ